MKHILLIALALCFFGGTLLQAQETPKEQPDEGKEAVAVVNKLFAAMQQHDAAAIRALFTSDGQLVAIDRTKDGTLRQRVFTGAAFGDMIAAGKGEYLEKMPEPKVHLAGDLALVYGRYTFHVGEKFSHCGTNSFHLIRTADGWKIAQGASTLEFKCDGK